MQSFGNTSVSVGRAVLRSANTAACFSSKSVSPRLPTGYGKTPPFGLFVKDNFAKIENRRVTERVSQLRDQWRSLSAEAKQKYFEKSNAEQREKAAKFAALNSDEQERLIESSKQKVEARKARKKRHEKAVARAESNHPPRPLSSYNLFIKEKMSKVESGEKQKVTDMLKQVAAEWKSMSDEAKKAYKEKAMASFAKPKDESSEKEVKPPKAAAKVE